MRTIARLFTIAVRRINRVLASHSVAYANRGIVVYVVRRGGFNRKKIIYGLAKKSRSFGPVAPSATLAS